MISKAIKIYLYLSPIDMRKSIDTLCMMISDVLNMNPTDGHVFLFRNRSGNKLKILHYQPNCFTLLYRRLEWGKFIFPKNNRTHIAITSEHLRWLLANTQNANAKLTHKKYEYFF